MIEVKNLIKNYYVGEVVTKVLRGIDLSVPSGQFLAVMGKSGAGKSTLLYQMSLLDEPTSGDVFLDGVDTSTLKSKERTRFRLEKLGYVFQEYALLPELTARENVMVPLIMEGIEKNQAIKIADNALIEVGLEHRLGYRPSQLSGGEQQRVAIARATSQDPDILFADEPTANLDTVSSKPVMNVLKELHARGQTIVMVTHEREYAQYAERVIHIEDGVIDRDEKMV